MSAEISVRDEHFAEESFCTDWFEVVEVAHCTSDFFETRSFSKKAHRHLNLDWSIEKPQELFFS